MRDMYDFENEGKRLPQQDTTRYMTDNNAAEIKSLSYVCKDRHIKSSKHYIKRKEKGEISMHKIPTYDMTCDQTIKKTHRRQ
jgi:hypothetical protein